MSLKYEGLQVLTLSLYIFLSGEGLSLLLLWAFFPLWVSLMLSSAKSMRSKPKGGKLNSFIIGSNLFTAPAMISWYLDIAGTKSGSSTSALIFAVMPIWAFIFGGVGILLYSASISLNNRL